MIRTEMGAADLASLVMPAPAEGEAFFELGIKYASGRSGPADLVAAHKWFNVGALILALLIPETLEGAEFGANVHLVHGRVEAHPRVAPDKGSGIVSQRVRPLGVLEFLKPVGQSEVAKVHDRHNPEPLHLGRNLV